jgi:hypothetical protein
MNPPDLGMHLGHHGDTIDDGADGDAERAAGAVLGDGGEVRLVVELDGLVPGVVAGHVALAAVDAHLLVDQRHLRQWGEMCQERDRNWRVLPGPHQAPHILSPADSHPWPVLSARPGMVTHRQILKWL